MDDPDALEFVAVLVTPFAASWAAVVLWKTWSQAALSRRCGRWPAFVLCAFVPVWTFVGVALTLLTLGYGVAAVVADLRPRPSGSAADLYAVLELVGAVVGLSLVPSLAYMAAVLASAKVRAWLARDPAGDD